MMCRSRLMSQSRGCLLSALLCATATAAAAPPVEKITLPLPWKVGQVLHYESEQAKTKTGPGTREKTVTTSKVEVKTVEAGKDGFVQHWRGHDAREEVIEGDKAAAELTMQAAKKLEDLPMIVEMDGDGGYRKLRNLDELGRRSRDALRPLMLELVSAGVNKAMAGAEPAKRSEALGKLPTDIEAMLQRLTAPNVLENLLTKDLQTVLNFTGASLDDDQSYELETSLGNPTGGAAFPAKLTFGLYVSKDEPEDVFLEWTLEIDPVKGATAIWDTVERMYGRTISEAERKELPAQVSIVDKGFLVFERATGLPEMYESVRTSKVGENANFERSRMRLLDGGHGHEWNAQNPQETEPEMTAAERDAQLCADEGADTQAAIAACSRILEDKGMEAKAQARWYAGRAWHRFRASQSAESVGDYGRALALAPGNVAFLLGRSRAQGQARDYRAALADATTAAALEPDSVLAHLFIGSAHDGLKEYAKAVEHHGRVTMLAPADARGYDARCWSRAMLGDYAGGKVDCNRALQLDPASWNSYNSRGYIHYRLADHARAVADNDKAIQNQPEVASSWYVRGLAKRAQGDAKDGDADIAKAIQLDAGVVERYAGYGVK